MEYYKPIKYRTRVHVSSWHLSAQAKPFDCPRKYYGSAHYRTFGLTDKSYIPKTTTQDLYLSGTTTKITERKIFRSEMTLSTYPLHGMRLKTFEGLAKISPEAAPQSHYQIDYKPPKPYKHKINCCVVEPDPLMNRIPKNDFEFQPSSPYKFMDDNFAKVGENRKKMNFLRQIRAVSKIPI